MLATRIWAIRLVPGATLAGDTPAYDAHTRAGVTYLRERTHLDTLIGGWKICEYSGCCSRFGN